MAAEHGLAIEDPPPEVRFEEFGDSTLRFRLLFWLRAGSISRARLASDLRFMIEKAFADAGIVIAYPQQDIHLDTSSPLRVEVLPPAQPTDSPRPAEGGNPSFG